jgi:DNA-binding MarR family transcriptional regulator
LTASGEQLQATIGREAAEPEAGVALGLPWELEGRLDFWAVCVLRAVGEQPWLTGGEIAARAGVEDPAQISRLLSQLAGLGLVDGVREAHGRGKPKVWQITDAGRQLDTAIGRKAPAPERSVALDLMRQSGGRLHEDAVSVLRVAAAEPGLSNGEIALRVGIADANSMSQLLARLVRRGLVENTRNGGRRNVWVLTAAGTALERAIRQETSAAASRSVALELLRESGGRLTHRAVSVLKVIAADPGLSNGEIAQRVGIASKGHTSTLLARLARYGLIENRVVNPLPFEANAWQLTAAGAELETAIQDPQGRTASPRINTAHHHRKGIK